MSRLTPAQIYQLARDAGFPAETATKMTAIALKESAGDPGAYNGVGRDDSYGLWQINMIGSLGTARLRQFGISDPAQLFDPATNARAAYLIWGGNDRNLDIAWAIYKSPVNAERYQNYLPVAEAAALAIEPTAADAVTAVVNSEQSQYEQTADASGADDLEPVYGDASSEAADSEVSPALAIGMALGAIGIAMLLND